MKPEHPALSQLNHSMAVRQTHTPTKYAEATNHNHSNQVWSTGCCRISNALLNIQTKVTAMFSGNVWDNWWGGGYTGVSAGWATGSLRLGNDADRFADAVSARTRGHFDKWIWRVERTQSLGGVSNWGLYLGANGQIGSKNLDSSEKFLLGGPSGVRGYPVGEASGDSGWLASAELRHDIPLTAGLSAQALVFVDRGHVRQHIDPWAGSVMPWTGNQYSLSSAGIGLNLQGARWSFRSAWARHLGDNPGHGATGLNADGQRFGQYLWLQASLRF